MIPVARSNNDEYAGVQGGYGSDLRIAIYVKPIAMIAMSKMFCKSELAHKDSLL